jgi:hypothetical protein
LLNGQSDFRTDHTGDFHRLVVGTVESIGAVPFAAIVFVVVAMMLRAFAELAKAGLVQVRKDAEKNR